MAEPPLRIQTGLNQRMRQRAVCRVGNKIGNCGANTQMRNENRVSTHTAEELIQPVHMVVMKMGDEEGINPWVPLEHGIHGMC